MDIQHPDTPQGAVDTVFAHAQMCAQAIDVLVQQIVSAREQMNGAVLDLSQRFAALYGSIESAGRASQAAAGDAGIAPVFEASSTELTRVVDTLRGAFARRNESVKQVQGVLAHGSALQGMVHSVAQLAAKTELLALNATIEAARAGPAGRGFSVVADEVRKLSAQSRQTSREMNERVAAINNEIHALADDATRAGAEEMETFALAEDTLHVVLDRLRGLAEAQGQSADILRREGERMRSEISHVIVALQFGDRVSQILAHACDGLQQLEGEVRQTCSDPGYQPDGEAFMQRLAETYTTDEQRRNHTGLDAGEGDAGGDITFF